MSAGGRARPPEQPASDRQARVRRLGVAVAVMVALLLFARTVYLVPDSAGHLAYLRSLLWDHDVDFGNDYARLGMIDAEPGVSFGARTAAGLSGNPFGVGSALLWSPFVALAALLARLLAALGVAVATDGCGTATLLAAQLGSWTYALGAGLSLAGCVGQALPEDGGPSSAAAGVVPRRAALLGALLGTPFIYYLLQMPSYSHVCAAFVTSLLCYLSLRWRACWTWRRALVLGAMVGLAGLVRVQALGFAVLPLLVARWGGALDEPPRAKRLAPFGGAALVTFLPQLLIWRIVYGAFVVPQGGGFLRWSPERLWEVLFDARHGLVAWSPVVLVAFAGWYLLARQPQTRRLGVALAAAFAVQWLAGALPVDWWAGWSFGARRFVACVPLFAVGIAAAARDRRVRAAVYLLVAANLVQWLRVATWKLSAEPDPGWNQLWGGGLLAFLPTVPSALVELASVPFSRIDILRRPTSIKPTLHSDPPAVLLLLVALWCAALLVAASRGVKGWRSERR